MSDAHLAEANLQSLQRRFRTPRVAMGIHFLRYSGDTVLDRVLESHYVRPPISCYDERYRARADEVLSYYGMLELAILTGTIDRDLPEALATEAKEVLGRIPFRRFYEHYYPVTLPRMLHERLSGPGLAPDERGDGFRLLSRFMALSRTLESRETRRFLAFLDDKPAGGYDLQSVLQTVRDPKAFVESMTRDTATQTSADRALNGFMRFLSFSSELDRFLRQLDDRRLLQSAFWHQHGYWFELIGGRVQGVLTAGIESLRQYAVPPGEQVVRAAQEWDAKYDAAEAAEDAVATQRKMDDAIRDLQRLTSSIYRYPLDDHLLRRSDPEPQPPPVQHTTARVGGGTRAAQANRPPDSERTA